MLSVNAHESASSRKQRRLLVKLLAERKRKRLLYILGDAVVLEAETQLALLMESQMSMHMHTCLFQIDSTLETFPY